LAVAPDVQFTGIKLDDESGGHGASILEGFHEALQHHPQVISVSLGYDLCPTDSVGNRTSNAHLTSLPNNLVSLEAEIRAAVQAGVVVVFSAGNGHVSFPGMMPDVISAGGVFVDPSGTMFASDYASAFKSKIYPGRIVPDFCGLVGMANNHADYIMLPLEPKCDIDSQVSSHDATANDDGWTVISGTSAAAPQLAGICALLLQKDSHLTPTDVKQILRSTCRDVIKGAANPASNEDNGGVPAGSGIDGATGAGLVDVFAALKKI
jgi:subtilisin family serine protease